MEKTPFQAFFEAQSPEIQDTVLALRNTIVAHLPSGFEEQYASNMLHYVVPHALYPAGYHCNPIQPLPFLSVAVLKNHIALYHMGLYADTAVLDWFKAAYAAAVPTRLDIGKSCIRFKKDKPLPLEIIGLLSEKMTVADWIAVYEKNIKGL